MVTIDVTRHEEDPGLEIVHNSAGGAEALGEAVLREVAKPHGYNVSPVRDLISLGGCRTATLDDPQGY